jgi:hypothetical protein
MLTSTRPRLVNPKLPVDLDRRESCRFHTVMRVARVTRARDAGLWRIRNISDGGMMMLTQIPVRSRERLKVALSESIELDARVAWWDDGRCGVAFDAPVDCAALLGRLVAEQKAPGYRPLRLPVNIRAIAFCDKGMHTIRLHNLSQHGAGFSHDGCFREGMATKLHFADGGEHRGVVRWVEGDRAGMLLTEPFPCEQLESACRL